MIKRQLKATVHDDVLAKYLDCRARPGISAAPPSGVALFESNAGGALQPTEPRRVSCYLVFVSPVSDSFPTNPLRSKSLHLVSIASAPLWLRNLRLPYERYREAHDPPSPQNPDEIAKRAYSRATPFFLSGRWEQS